MERIGSQIRESYRDAGYVIHRRNPDGTVVLRNCDGDLDLYAPNDNFAGHVITINGEGYEYVRSVDAENAQVLCLS